MRRLLTAVSVFVVGLVSTGCCCPADICFSALPGALAAPTAVARSRGDVPPPMMPAATVTLAQSH